MYVTSLQRIHPNAQQGGGALAEGALAVLRSRFDDLPQVAVWHDGQITELVILYTPPSAGVARMMENLAFVLAGVEMTRRKHSIKDYVADERVLVAVAEKTLRNLYASEGHRVFSNCSCSVDIALAEAFGRCDRDVSKYVIGERPWGGFLAERLSTDDQLKCWGDHLQRITSFRDRVLKLLGDMLHASESTDRRTDTPSHPEDPARPGEAR